MKRKELDELVSVGLITAEQREAIEIHFRQGRGRGSRWLMLCLSWLAAAFVVAGVVMLVSANWESIPPLVKMSSGMGLMLAAWVAWACCVKGWPVLAEFFGLVGGGMWLANLALYGQIFQIQLPFVEGVAVFLAGIVLLPFVVRQRLLLGAVAVTSVVWLIALFQTESGESVLSLYAWKEYAAASCMLLLAAWWLFGENCYRCRGGYRTYSWIAVPALLAFLMMHWESGWLGEFPWRPGSSGEEGWYLCWCLWGGVPLLMLLARPGVPWLSWLVLTVLMASLQPVLFILGKEWGFGVEWELCRMLLLFLCALALMLAGMQGNRPFWINAGALLVVCCGFNLASDFLDSYTGSGLVMVGCGALLLLFTIVLEKSRRRMMRAIAERKEIERADPS